MAATPSEIRRATRSLGENRSVDATGEAEASLTPELVIALCGPIGSPLHAVADQIDNTLRDFGYRTEKLRLSEIIKINASDVGKPINSASRFDEIKSLIDAGDELRRIYGNDILAKLAIAKIRADRDAKFGDFIDKANDSKAEPGKRIAAQRVCHVIDSIKNKSELELLRLIYGDALFAVGVFSPLKIRRINLEQPGAFRAEQIDDLIDTDSGEEFSHGQSVRDTFPRCDFFLRVDHPITGATEGIAVGQIVEKTRRFFSLIFRTSVVTPTAEEAAMYASASAARSSACLSRQVGAAVTSGTGEVLAVGWNDVPQSGGGLYGKPTLDPHAQPKSDRRCFAMAGAKCHNDEEKKGIALKVVESLIKESLLDPSSKELAIKTITTDSRVKDLIEFSRAVHAEMHAVLGASRVAGERVIGGKIFVTTYPCHSCARHIVAAGISEIHYIEPYRKSMAIKLHSDSLSESVEDVDKVRLFQFDGVAPRRFIDIFEAGDRKQGGVLSLQKKDGARPATQVSLKAIPRLEEVVVAEVTSKNLRLLRPVDEKDQLNGQDPTTPPPASAA